MKERVQFGSVQIEFCLEFSGRKTLGITITPDAEVLVKAPTATPIDKIKEKVKKKAPWIIRQQRFFLTFHPKTTVRKFIGGETHLYLGRQYRLKIFESETESVKLKGSFLEIATTNNSRVKQLVIEWYSQNAKRKFQSIAEPLINRFRKRQVTPSSIVLKEMPTRWGSCTPRGKIILNPELIKAPRGCIEYVIIHELCHLVHHDHTQKFIELQTREMPDWEKWKMKLERMLA